MLNMKLFDQKLHKLTKYSLKIAIVIDSKFSGITKKGQIFLFLLDLLQKVMDLRSMFCW